MILKFWFEEIDRSQWWSKTMSLICEYVKDLQRFMQKQFAMSFIIGERTKQVDWLKLLFWINSQEICLELPYIKALPFPKSNMFRLGLATYEKTD